MRLLPRQRLQGELCVAFSLLMPSNIAPPTPTARPVDAAALARVLRRMHAAEASPWLHEEAARRMAERLFIVRMQPQTVLAWGAQVGGGLQALRSAYPKARVQAVEPLAASSPPASARKGFLGLAWPLAGRRREEALQPAAVQPGSAGLVWSNMGLHGVADPQALLQQWHAALAVDGFLMFSTLGPGSLPELRAAYERLGWGPAHAPFVDMHDIGDMLVAAGYADPVMDQEVLTLSWAGVPQMLAELRSLGGNAALARFRGLRTPRWHARMQAALQQELKAADDGRVRLSFELVYGHAFKPQPRQRGAAQTSIPVDELRRSIRQRGGAKA